MMIRHSGKISNKNMNKLFGGVYKGRRVLITGHTGFKGSWLALWLNKLGAEVVGYSIDIPTKPNHFELLKLNIISIQGDVLNKKKLYKTIKKHKPDIIFHLAAQSLVRKSYTNPTETFETNIIGTINVLESCRRLGKIKAIVNITSDKCYQNTEKRGGYKEGDPMGGNDPYSASKGSVELVAQSYRKSFFPVEAYKKNHSTLLANARAGNVIGGGDWAKDRLIPDVMRAVKKRKKGVIRNPDSIRPWQHVLEPLSGYLKLGQKLLEGKKEFADNWNFGPNNKSEVRVEEILKRAKNYWSKIDYKIYKDKNNFHEAGILKLNSSKARKLLGWKNIWGVKKTIEKTINWYQKYYDEKTILSEENLEEYVKDLGKLRIKNKRR